MFSFFIFAMEYIMVTNTISRTPAIQMPTWAHGINTQIPVMPEAMDIAIRTLSNSAAGNPYSSALSP